MLNIKHYDRQTDILFLRDNDHCMRRILEPCNLYNFMKKKAYSQEKQEVLYENVQPLLNRVGLVETKEAIEIAREKNLPIHMVAVMVIFRSFMETMEEQRKAIKKGPGRWLILKPNEKVRKLAMLLVLLSAFACKPEEPTPRPVLGYKSNYNVFIINDGDKVEQKATARVADSTYAKSSINGTAEMILNVASNGGYSSRMMFGSSVIGDAIKAKSNVDVEINTAKELKVRYKIYFTNSQVIDGFLWVKL